MFGNGYQLRRLTTVPSFILFLLLFIPQLSFGTVLSDLASQMQPGTWAELTGMSGWNSGGVLNPLDVSGCTTGDYITQFAEKAAWDPIGQRVMFVGQTHGNCYAGRFVIYSNSTNAWTQGPWMPGVCQSGTPTSPCFSHAYDHNTADPATGDMYFRQAFTNQFFRFRNGAWSSIPAPPAAANLQCCGVLEYFPDMHRVIFIDGDWGVWSFDPSSSAWTPLANTNGANAIPGLPNLSMISYQNFGLYNPVKKVLLFGGGTNLYKMSPTGTLTTLAAPPVTLEVTASVISVDSVSGDYIVLSGSTMYRYDVTTDTWSQVNTIVPSTLTALSGVGDGLIQAPITSYGVIMYIKYNYSSSKVYIYKHASSGGTTPPDTQAPTVPGSLTATVASSSQINLSWTASTDNVGVSAYRVERCQGAGCTTFTQIATPTATTLSDTGLTSSTTFNYRVRATDAAGNLSGYSTTASATTQASVVTSADTDFSQRCAASGVVRCVNFDTDTDFNQGSGGSQGAWGYNSGILPSGSNYSNVNRDATIKASGASSLRFTIPSNSAAGGSGSWFTNFSNDLSYQVGAGQEVYIQWRQRFSPEYLTTQYSAVGGGLAGGWKLADISGGDLPSCAPGTANSTSCPTSCWDFEVVVQNVNQRGLPQTYANCAGPWAYAPMNGYTSNVTVQNAVGCLYPDYISPPCVKFFANEWMTFQIHIKVGTWNSWSSTVQLWVAREGQPSVLVIDCSPTAAQPCTNFHDGSAAGGWYLYNSNTNYKIGKVWLLPYHTNKDPTQVTPTAYTWYDELIISRSRIADPGATTTTTQIPTGPGSLIVQ
jgi:hypothetical protein